jgi:D-alanyl-D-alanine carboxypeptidase
MRLVAVIDRHRLIVPLLLCVSTILLSGGAVAGPYSALVADIDTEQVLYERNADELRHPASLTKMMTLYLVFEALTNGQLFTDTVFRASRFAVMRPPSRLGLTAGDTLTVEESILGLVTRSANDAAAVIAESMAGSESAFAAMMTEKARQLGMSRTVFRNASGLPDPNQVTTAWDMFRLGKALNKHFPQFYPYFSTGTFYYGGQSFHNHNHLLESYPGTDGIKTGFVNASGFNLVASAQRGSHRLIGVVFGGSSASRRDAHMREILDDGFAQLEGAPPGVHVVEFERQAPPVLLARPGAAEDRHEAGRRKRSPKAVHLRFADSRTAHPRAQGDGRETSVGGRGKHARNSRQAAAPRHRGAAVKSRPGKKTHPARHK